MTLLKLFNNSNSKNRHTVLVGEDDFLNEYLVDNLTKEAEQRNLEKVIIDCESDGLDELIASLTEANLFANERLVIVKNPFFLTAKTPKKFEREVKQLSEIFSHVAELEDTIVMIASYEKLDRRKKLVKMVEANFNVVETKIKPYELLTIVKAFIANDGMQISERALQTLIDHSDQVMDVVLNNYLKLKNIATDNKITEDLIMRNIDMSLSQNVFAILEEALRKDYRQANERLDDQLREGTNPVQLIAIFQNQLELLVTAKVLAQRGRDETQIVKELSVHPYRIKLALRNRSSILHLKRLLLQLIELEYKYKSGVYHSEKFLKMFLVTV